MSANQPERLRRTPLLRPFPENLHPQLEVTCRELNQRIARLALALNLSLDDEADMNRVMNHPHTATAPGGVVLGMLAFGQETQRREEQLWTELRGLIVLRHELEKLCADAVGYVATGDILVEVEQKMAQSGFTPGADGIDLEDLLGTPADAPPRSAAD